MMGSQTLMMYAHTNVGLLKIRRSVHKIFYKSLKSKNILQSDSQALSLYQPKI